MTTTLFTYTVTLTGLGLVLLIIILPATLVSFSRSTGTPAAQRFYGTPYPWITPQTPCTGVRNLTYNGEAQVQSETLFNGDFVPSRFSNLAWAMARLVADDMFTLARNESDMVPGTNVTRIIAECTVDGCCNLANEAVTTILDMTWLYGANEMQVAAVRSHVRGMLQLQTGGYFTSRYTNEDALLASMATLFARVHNRWANELFLMHPAWSDDDLFWKARSYTIAQYQAIVYYEWVPDFFQFNDIQQLVETPVPVSGHVTTEFATLASHTWMTLYNNGNVTTQNDIDAAFSVAWRTPADTYDTRVNATLHQPYVFPALVDAQTTGLAPFNDIAAAFGVYSSGGTLPQLYDMFASGFQLNRAIFANQLARCMASDPLFISRAPSLRQYLGPTYYDFVAGTRLGQLIYDNTGVRVPPQSSAFYVA